MFGLETFVLNTSSLHGLDAPFYKGFANNFKCHDRNILSWCMYYMDVLPLRYVYFENKINFLSKMLKTEMISLSLCSIYLATMNLLSYVLLVKLVKLVTC